MIFFVYHSLDRRDAASLKWGGSNDEVHSARLRLLQDEPLTESDVKLLSAHPLRLGEPLANGASYPHIFGFQPYILSKSALEILTTYQSTGITVVPANVIREATGEPLANYFMLRVETFIDFVDYDRTIFSHGAGLEAAKRSGFSTRLKCPYQVREDRVGIEHLWRSSPPAGRLHFASSELQQAMIKNGINGWTFTPCQSGASI